MNTTLAECDPARVIPYKPISLIKITTPNMDADNKVVKVRQDELKDYVASADFKGLEHVPLSPYRVNSYLRNPRARAEDIVLYLLFEKGELVAYRCIIGDQCFPDSEGVHIGWFSGNWTHPRHRRKGYSSLLLKEARKDWNDRLIFSNYAPVSKDVLDYGGGFVPIKVLHGQRYYFKSGLATLLPPKSGFFASIQPLLSGIDRLFNAFLSKKSPPLAHSGHWEKISALQEEDLRFMSAFKERELFRRDGEEYNWILRYPWVQTTPEAREWRKRYHFSVYAEQFEQSFYRISGPDGVSGIILITIRDGAMKVPYAYVSNDALPQAAKLLQYLRIQQNVLYLTIFHKGIIRELNKLHGFSLFRKKFDQAFLTSDTFLSQYPKMREKAIQKGDGDAVFT